MNSKLPPDIASGMTEAARLTRAGRLSEATALIQRLLHGTAPDTASAPAGNGIVIDAEPISSTVDEPTAKSRYEAPRPNLRDALHDLTARFTPANGGLRPTKAAEPLPDGASFTTLTYSAEAGTRQYKLYVPSGRDGQRLPLVVMLHGCTQSPDDFAAGTRMNALAEEHGLLVAYPAQPASANAQKCWNWFDPDCQQRDRGEPALIAGITRQIMRDHPVDPSRVYVAGLSAGGAAAAIMGATYPDLYAAIGVHSGLACGAARDLPSALAAMRQGGTAAGVRNGDRIVPTIVFHGDKDTTVHPRNGDMVINPSKKAGALRETVQRGQVPDGRAYSRAVYTDSAGRELCEQWTVHGAGHAWFGGSPAGSYTDPQGPDAAREMLRFFLNHPHP